MGKSEWLSGKNSEPPKCILNPQTQAKILNISPSSSPLPSPTANEPTQQPVPQQPAQPPPPQKQIIIDESINKPVVKPSSVLNNPTTITIENGKKTTGHQPSTFNGSPSENKENAQVQPSVIQQRQSIMEQPASEKSVVFRSNGTQSNVVSTNSQPVNTLSADNRKTKGFSSLFFNEIFKTQINII